MGFRSQCVSPFDMPDRAVMYARWPSVRVAENRSGPHGLARLRALAVHYPRHDGRAGREGAVPPGRRTPSIRPLDEARALNADRSGTLTLSGRVSVAPERVFKPETGREMEPGAAGSERLGHSPTDRGRFDTDAGVPDSMTRFEASTPAERRALVAEAVTAHRKRGSEAAVFMSEEDRIRYADRVVRFDVIDDERDRLDALLGEFPVFKIKQPDTRKAEQGVVYVSAIADAKHVADFIEAAFRDVFEHEEEHTLRVVRV